MLAFSQEEVWHMMAQSTLYYLAFGCLSCPMNGALS